MLINIKVIKAYLRVESAMADFYKNNFEVTLNSNTEILRWVSKELCTFHWLLNKGDEVLI